MSGLFGTAWRPALLLSGLMAAGFAVRGLGGGSLADLLAHAGHGVWPALAFFMTGAALCAVGVPRQAVCFSAGYAFGALPGGALALTAQLAACALNLIWARLVARAWLARRLGRRLAQLDRGLARRPFVTILMLRLLPVGNNLLLNLLAGVAAAPPGRVLAASLLGYLPQTAVFALAGGGVQIGRASQLALGAGTLALSLALGALLAAKWRRADIAAA